MTINLYNLVILVGAIHGLLLAALLVIRKPNKSKNSNYTASILLALVLIFYTLPVMRVTLHDMGFYNVYTWPVFSIELLYGLGPSLYLYTKTLIHGDQPFSRHYFWHFTPVILELMYYFSPLYFGVSDYLITSPSSHYDVFWLLQQFGAILSVLIYFLLSIKSLMRYSSWVKNNHSDLHQKNLDWIKKPIILYSLFFFLWFTLRAYDVLFYSDLMPLDNYYPLLFLLSFTTYWIGTKGYLRKQAIQVSYNENLNSRVQTSSKNDDILQKTLLKNTVKDAQAFKQLSECMIKQKPYLINDLTLAELAEIVCINSRALSKLINENAGTNFYDYINTYRLNEFKTRISQDQKSRILDLAFDSGFNSKTTFNSIFKSHTGMTPSQFRKSL